MNLIRFIRMSEALSRRGHHVHLVVNGSLRESLSPGGPTEVGPDRVRWREYDLVKTFFHSGFAALTEWGGDSHPFIVSSLGSVVGATDDEEGVYFFGSVREALWRTQQAVAAKSRVVSLLTDRNAALYRRMHGERENTMFVPCGVDAEVPQPGQSPYAALGITQPVALFAGNVYVREKQPEVNLFWQARLNALGRALAARGVRLVAMGPGLTDRLDPTFVTHVGVVDFRDVWHWQWHARVGVVLAQGAVQDNESSKIYYYLRTGLPVACEASIPNSSLVRETGHGVIVAYDDEDIRGLAAATADLALETPAADTVGKHMARHHSWDVRAGLYAETLAAACPD